ncbi:MAG: hypothetical protein AAF633_18835 [Chloroflexota bacterium]
MQRQLLQTPGNFFYNLFIILLIIIIVVAAYFFLLNPSAISPIMQDFRPVDFGEAVGLREPNPSHILFDETFDTNTGIWTLSPPDQARFFGGGLLLDDNQFNSHAGAQLGLSFDNFLLKVNTRWVGGSIGGGYGVRFRQSSDSSFYAFYLHNDGRYTIGRQIRTESNWVEFTNAYSDAINTSGGVNAIQIEVIGTQMRFFVNGEFLAAFEDDRLGIGDVELVSVKAENTEQYMAGFDNLQIYQLFEDAVPEPEGTVSSEE